MLVPDLAPPPASGVPCESSGQAYFVTQATLSIPSSSVRLKLQLLGSVLSLVGSQINVKLAHRGLSLYLPPCSAIESVPIRMCIVCVRRGRNQLLFQASLRCVSSLHSCDEACSPGFPFDAAAYASFGSNSPVATGTTDTILSGSSGFWFTIVKHALVPSGH